MRRFPSRGGGGGYRTTATPGGIRRGGASTAATGPLAQQSRVKLRGIAPTTPASHPSPNLLCPPLPNIFFFFFFAGRTELGGGGGGALPRARRPGRGGAGAALLGGVAGTRRGGAATSNQRLAFRKFPFMARRRRRRPDKNRAGQRAGAAVSSACFPRARAPFPPPLSLRPRQLPEGERDRGREIGEGREGWGAVFSSSSAVKSLLLSILV